MCPGADPGVSLRDFGGAVQPHRPDRPSRFVLRKKPHGSHRLVERVPTRGAGRPTRAAVHHLCEDTDIVGTAFYVMDYVEGSVDQDPAWPALAADRRSALYGSMADVLARLHSVDWRGLGLGDYGKEGNYIARQMPPLGRPVRGLAHHEIPEMDRLIAWLPDHIPDDDETTIVHGVPAGQSDRARAGAAASPRCSKLAPWAKLATSPTTASPSRSPAARRRCRARRRRLRGAGAAGGRGAPGRLLRTRGPGRDRRLALLHGFAFFRMAACQGVYARGLKGPRPMRTNTETAPVRPRLGRARRSSAPAALYDCSHAPLPRLATMIASGGAPSRPWPLLVRSPQ